MMKRTAILFFTIFYLVSSVGFASVEHYCHMMHHKTTVPEDGCCCAVPPPSSECCSETHQSEPVAKSCDIPDASASRTDAGKTLVISSQNCCDTVTRYHQVDESTPRTPSPEAAFAPLPVTNLTFCLSKDLFHICEFPVPFTLPSFQFNIPLLI